jgi:predicted dehydrogenase
MKSSARAAIPAAVTTKVPIAARRPTRFALVGNGWRSNVYIRMAYLMPERFDLVGMVTRRAEAGARLEHDWDVPTFRTIDDLLAAGRPDFVVLSVPWPLTPQITRQLASAQIRVLAETPPAPDLDGLRSLWSDVGASGLVQVAEQYALMPLHAARLAIARDGLIGRPTSVHVSSTHLYHVVSLIRLFLGVEFEPATVCSQTFATELVDPISQAGWTRDATSKPAENIISTVDFGAAGMGLYDFTTNQWFNPLRPDHLTVRGTAGEIHDDAVIRMIDTVTPVTSRIERAMSGFGMNYEGLDLNHLTLDGKVIFRNPYEGARLSDDDVAVAALLDATGAWSQGDGPPPYPLSRACQDHLIGLAITESAATGQPVTTGSEPWAA